MSFTGYCWVLKEEVLLLEGKGVGRGFDAEGGGGTEGLADGLFVRLREVRCPLCSIENCRVPDLLGYISLISI